MRRPFHSHRFLIEKPQWQILNTEIIVNPLLKNYILFGYAAKGAIYFLIGILAIEAAILPERKAVGTYHALKHLSTQPWGTIVLCILAFTLQGYILRRLLQAIIYPGHSQSWGLTALLQRFGYIISSLSYAGVVYSALSIVLGTDKYNHTIKHVAANLLVQPEGKWLLMIGGMMVFGVGISYVYGAYTGSYISNFALSNPKLEAHLKLIGKIGVATRGVTFMLIGSLIVRAFISSNSELAGGLRNAFDILSQGFLGWLWLVLLGSGFIAYGVYMFAAARYRRYVIR